MSDCIAKREGWKIIEGPSISSQYDYKGSRNLGMQVHPLFFEMNVQFFFQICLFALILSIGHYLILAPFYVRNN